MQKTVRGRVIPVRLDEEEVERIDRFVERAGTDSRSGFIRDAVEYYLGNVAEMKVIELKDATLAQAKKEVIEYIRTRKEAETFEIANDLRLDLSLTAKALKELWEEGRIK